ncbi:MAG: endonuclease/exonuclease/phosphatase family protein [Actinomycetota bacterium]
MVKVVTGLIGAAIASALLPIVSAPPAAAAQDGRQILVQYNLYGAKGGTGYNHDVAPAVVNSIYNRDPTPSVISFNEICWYQWDYIWSMIRFKAPYGLEYIPFAHWSIQQEDDCYGSGYGNVIVSLRGAGTYGVDKTFSSQTGGVELRGAACLANLIYSAVACSTHLAPPDSNPNNPSRFNVPRTQQWELSVLVNQWATQGTPLFVLGDFNLLPSENLSAFSGWWYQVFAEGDRASPNATVSNKRSTWRSSKPPYSQRAIDYAFRRAPNLFTADSYIYFGDYSDHAWYETYVS